jgi:arginyl-tRNA synthetase
LLAKKLGDAGTKLSPPDAAKKLADALPEVDVVQKFEAVKAFVNIFLSAELVGKKITKVFKNVCLSLTT